MALCANHVGVHGQALAQIDVRPPAQLHSSGWRDFNRQGPCKQSWTRSVAARVSAQATLPLCPHTIPHGFTWSIAANAEESASAATLQVLQCGIVCAHKGSVVCLLLLSKWFSQRLRTKVEPASQPASQRSQPANCYWVWPAACPFEVLKLRQAQAHCCNPPPPSLQGCCTRARDTSLPALTPAVQSARVS
jgi:hypothetical protein